MTLNAHLLDVLSISCAVLLVAVRLGRRLAAGVKPLFDTGVLTNDAWNAAALPNFVCMTAVAIWPTELGPLIETAWLSVSLAGLLAVLFVVGELLK